MANPPTKPPAQKLCFIVGPIGGNDTEDRVHADWLLEEIIKPVFDAHFADFRVERADKIPNPGRIDEQIITALLSAELVIADLTTLNPNAFYEIGIRHAIQKPTIHMHLEGQKIPFDIGSFRSIEFSRKWPKDIRAAREILKDFVETATADDYVVDNPVTFSRGKVEFAKTATAPEKIIQDQLSDIVRRLGTIEGIRQREQSSAHLAKVRDTLLNSVLSRNAVRDTGKILIKLSPHDVQGIASFPSDLQKLLAAHVSYFATEEATQTSAVVSIPDSADNREAVRNLVEDARRREIDVTLSEL
ncbi:hypothetical protein [Mesorhizobium sp. ES1-1]|uniref:hypothetical protein n=1 Tax=Mesorhizobium sp. ES1-1 TaxID=2876629 RepID=UPI001CC971CC|nr:hypothetical protein [Mesorhizobium sp. ES1-1]MBZ9674516.1 hypothetical protein [Mesorhizobium sp. ES1-1]